MNPSGPPIWQVDAFTNRPFRGNPAAVCILSRFPEDAWMQAVAAEMNLAETAFVVPTGQANQFQLRWFTPTVEVDLCGHATLAAAHILYEDARAVTAEPIRFASRSGELICTRAAETLTLDFPATPPEPVADIDLVQQTLNALECHENAEVFQSRFDLMVVLQHEETIRSLTPDFAALGRLETRGIIVTAASEQPGIDFVSRFFAPRCGIDEDPVTGSAHCCLAPFWAGRFGRTQLTGYQASQRGGTVLVEVSSDRVRLAGKALTVFTGRLLVPPD